jgi:hypothetical protein
MRSAIIAGTVLLTAAGAGAALGDAAAQPAASKPESPIRRFEDTADHVRIVAVDRENGSDDRAVVVVMIDPGYHINANPASMPYLIPTTLNVTTPTALRVLYPEAVRFKPKFLDDMLDVYDGTIRVIAEFPSGLLAHEGRVLGTLTAQACTDVICLPPADLELPDR